MCTSEMVLVAEPVLNVALNVRADIRVCVWVAREPRRVRLRDDLLFLLVGLGVRLLGWNIGSCGSEKGLILMVSVRLVAKLLELWDLVSWLSSWILSEEPFVELVSVSLVNFVNGSEDLESHPDGEAPGEPVDHIVPSVDHFSLGLQLKELEVLLEEEDRPACVREAEELKIHALQG